MEVLHSYIVSEVIFAFSSVAALLNVSLEVPELYRSGRRLIRVFLKVLYGQEEDIRVSSALCRDERRLLDFAAAQQQQHHLLLLARWSFPPTKCCCCS